MESARPHRRRTATAFHNVSHQFWARSARRQCLIVSTAFSPLDFVLIGCSRLGRKARRKKVFDQALGILAFHGVFFHLFSRFDAKNQGFFCEGELGRGVAGPSGRRAWRAAARWDRRGHDF